MTRVELKARSLAAGILTAQEQKTVARAEEMYEGYPDGSLTLGLCAIVRRLESVVGAKTTMVVKVVEEDEANGWRWQWQCAGCGRPEDECSAAPCLPVQQDRER